MAEKVFSSSRNPRRQNAQKKNIKKRDTKKTRETPWRAL